MGKRCLYCNKIFVKPYNESKKNWENRHKFCSRECVDKYKIGKDLIDIVGQRFGRLTVLEYAGSTEYRASRWKCQCDCGKTKIIQRGALINGLTVSCGCLNNENAKRLGLSNVGKNNGMFGRIDGLNPAWKGDKVGYYALHTWLGRKLGKAKRCSNSPLHKCNKYYWANISGEYKRDLSDWKQVCARCNMTDGIHIHKRFKAA